MSAISDAYTAYTISPLTSELSFTTKYPLWNRAAQVTRQHIGALWIREHHLGCVLFIDEKTILTPLHVVNPGLHLEGLKLQEYLSQLTVNFDDGTVCYRCEIEKILEQSPYHDFCLLRLKQHLPVLPISISYGNPFSVLFVQMDKDGIIEISIVQTCTPDFWDSGFCTYAQTCPGSSGGCYFDINGSFVAMHLSRSTGACAPDTGAERKGILAKDLELYSLVLQANARQVCLNPSLLPTHPFLHSVHEDVCFDLEKGSVKGDFILGNDYKVDYQEIRSGRTQRNIFITIKDQLTHQSMICEYELKAVNGNQRSNIHNISNYNKHAEQFYQNIAIQIAKCRINQRYFPETLTLTYDKHEIFAQSTRRHFES